MPPTYSHIFEAILLDADFQTSLHHVREAQHESRGRQIIEQKGILRKDACMAFLGLVNMVHTFVLASTVDCGDCYRYPLGSQVVRRSS